MRVYAWMIQKIRDNAPTMTAADIATTQPLTDISICLRQLDQRGTKRPKSKNSGMLRVRCMPLFSQTSSQPNTMHMNIGGTTRYMGPESPRYGSAEKDAAHVAKSVSWSHAIFIAQGLTLELSGCEAVRSNDGLAATRGRVHVLMGFT